MVRAVILGMLRNRDAVKTPIPARNMVRMNQTGKTSQTGGFLSKNSIAKPQKSIWYRRREKTMGERALSSLTMVLLRFT